MADYIDGEDGEGEYDRQIHEKGAFDPGRNQGGFGVFFVGVGLGFVSNHFYSEQAMMGSSSSLVWSQRRPSSSMRSIAALGPQVLGAYC